MDPTNIIQAYHFARMLASFLAWILARLRRGKP
jgi:hypothetical protein